MKNVLVLGGSGMLGSMVVDYLSRQSGLALTATVRSEALRDAMASKYPRVCWHVANFAGGIASGELFAQEWIVNAIGITKPLIRDDNAVETMRAIEINSRLPHLVGREAEARGARVLQIATDCVYSGAKGQYTETDAHDALDVYGKTKSLGECFLSSTQHLRCSIIGPEPKEFKFLIEWFRRQPSGASVNGFTNHHGNGVTTLHFAKICQGFIANDIPLTHLQHVVPSGMVTKARMLHDFARAYGREDIVIRDVEAKTVIDRTLATHELERNSEIWRAAGYEEAPTVTEMIEELGHWA
jgi:dTDP-4-dehydrorhamnose reductase